MWTPTNGLQQVQAGSQTSSVAIQVSQRVFQETGSGSFLGGSFLSENKNVALMRESPILPPVPGVPHLNSVSDLCTQQLILLYSESRQLLGTSDKFQ